ncbi:phosphoribosylformylglycinamidine cyclo-ligase [Phycisphaera mikurensis]|uniref:Phosphoribosylformylglycinamidine cyclo-ligase n=1 Tax=Phycisphaera mikurensis (strain NBRC 102666 / KCTC 22515 / FYK2301M01) TaxID=1142394 RepID=I0IAL1_PHYMF|nr:phosphoribosylformylglycinamidine cyclo-ligase [Phycisphaera mikurensis]MBB6441705.1 phosphoribosylformylglycinamidine cyclo-ligase [Phycisphaera mikurensis]BAM02299.1 phosphoribosylformylglycinamidine cyclo-ligase [Phycisphaera mikurensis NBRC 102666]
MAKQRDDEPMTYAASGVDIDAGDRAAERIRHHLKRTYGPRVMGQEGAFAGMLRLDYNEKLFSRNYKDPVLVACTDGVGTKVKLAIRLGKHDTIGRDCVAMNVNDLIVQGAEPLLFLDYVGLHEVTPAFLERVVRGVADGCAEAGCALLGGETAEMPDVYAEDDYDLAGFAVGVVELSRAIKGTDRVAPGDVVLGLASSGIHANGFSLVRAIVDRAGLDLRRVYDGYAGDPVAGGRPLGEALLEPTRIYAKPIVSLLRSYSRKRPVVGMAHITGGGLPGNLNRALPEDCDAALDRSSWRVPDLFGFLQEHGRVETEEMFRVFNMGVGYTLIVRPHFAEGVADRLRRSGETVYELGEIVRGKGEVRL